MRCHESDWEFRNVRLLSTEVSLFLSVYVDDRPSFDETSNKTSTGVVVSGVKGTRPGVDSEWTIPTLGRPDVEEGRPTSVTGLEKVSVRNGVDHLSMMVGPLFLGRFD